MSAECTHTLDSGHKCQAPARNGSTFCHHHTPHAHLDPHPRETHESQPIELPPLDSKTAVLAAVSEVLYAASERRIKCSEARTLLLGLRFAHRLMVELDQERLSSQFETQLSPELTHSTRPAQSSQPQASTPASHPAGKLTPRELDDFTQRFQKAAVQHLRDQAAARE